MLGDFYISNRKIFFFKLPLILNYIIDVSCLGLDYFYVVKDEYTIISFSSISKRSIGTLFLSRNVVPERLRLFIRSIKNNST